MRTRRSGRRSDSIPPELSLTAVVPPAPLVGLDVFPVPPQCFVNAAAQIFCEQNLQRDATITQYAPDGKTVLQLLNVHYDSANDTGTGRQLLFTKFDSMTWLRVQYAPGPVDSRVFVVDPKPTPANPAGYAVLFEERYHSGEGVFRIIYSPNKAEAKRSPFIVKTHGGMVRRAS